MGNCFSVSLPCDPVVNQVSSCLGAEIAYIRNLENNLEDLQNKVRELTGKRVDLLKRIEMEEDRGLQRLAEVGTWLSAASTIETQVDNLLNRRDAEIQRLCLCGYASRNCVSSHEYGKEVFQRIEGVEELISKGNFTVVAAEVSSSRMDKRLIQPNIIGTEATLEEAWNLLMDDEVGTLGLYGMGGVGKTTVLTQINNKLCESTGMFDVLIWVVVSKDLQTDDLQAKRIQDGIGKKLNIITEEWKHETQDEKAKCIVNALSGKKFVLFLDDIWGKVKLEKIGVPFPNKENGCKVVFTTRSKEVCGRMGSHKEIEVKCLEDDDAWDLFKKKVREETLKSHSDITDCAKIIVQKCRGLPLALNIIGETMASRKTIQEWENAVDVLTSSSAAEYPGMDEILPILKFSYDNLKKEEVKLCFLYCALFPEDYLIIKRLLVDYWVCEGIIHENTERKRVENEGFEIINTLVRACLLEVDSEEDVIMHDVVRAMALWISSDFEKERGSFVVETNVGLHRMPKIGNRKCVSRMSLMENNIENICGIPECLTLRTLFLSWNPLRNISSEFFRSIPNLVVLDLSENKDLKELPEEISMLMSLRYLDLLGTNIVQLPNGLKELKNLVGLNLEFTESLQSVDGISSLSNLQILRLKGSSVVCSLSLMEELLLLEHLNCLTISFKDALVLKRFQRSYKLTRCVEELGAEDLVSTSDGISFVVDLEGLRYLDIRDSKISEIKIDGKSEGSRMVEHLNYHKGPCNSYLQNLQRVALRDCRSLRDVTSLLFVPNIVSLYLRYLPDFKEIIRKEKVPSDTNEQPFGRLQKLELDNLPEMESIYWDPLLFSTLQEFKIRKCPKLRKLPLNSKSAEGCKLYIRVDKELMEQIEWEDEYTKKRFFPLS